MDYLPLLTSYALRNNVGHSVSSFETLEIEHLVWKGRKEESKETGKGEKTRVKWKKNKERKKKEQKTEGVS